MFMVCVKDNPPTAETRSDALLMRFGLASFERECNTNLDIDRGAGNQCSNIAHCTCLPMYNCWGVVLYCS